MRGTERRRGGKKSAARDRRPPPPTPTAATPDDAWRYMSAGGRDSDASFASSRPSSSSFGLNPRTSGVILTERNYQTSAIRAVNAFLSNHSLPFSLKLPLPLSKDITHTIRFILSEFGFPAQNIEDEFYYLVKSLNCPVKYNKSALRAPGTPHFWPSLLAAIHWLVQLLMYNNHQSSSTQTQLTVPENRMFRYFLETYMHFIRADDDEVEKLDNRIKQEVVDERQRIVEETKALERTAQELEEKLEVMKVGPSEVEVLKAERTALEGVMKKSRDMLEKLEEHKAARSAILEEKEKCLEVKIAEKERIFVENESLKRRVEEQGINARDAERMKWDLQALEGSIAEIEDARNKWEDKGWEVDSMIGHDYKKLEQLMIEANQAMRRLKLGNEFHFQLEAKGSSTREVLGIDYKSILKPALASLDEEVKKSSMEKLEGLISLRKQDVDKTAKIEAKKNRIFTLEAHSNEVEEQLDLMRRETMEFASRNATEAKKMVEAAEEEGQSMGVVEREAAELVKVSSAKLQEVITQSVREVQTCARELFVRVDLVSKHKENISSKAAAIRNDLFETASAIADIHKGVLPAPDGHIS
ncbi:unnamed protein product [Cuscuta campestris]|uniref:Kinetochore protein NDC80 n=1 Tax=Cuscuta campestris TaxID=132261 RepID=A0A484LL23_9ASTE|nr:unnamed protein product [Cuscuta campestris]